MGVGKRIEMATIRFNATPQFFMEFGEKMLETLEHDEPGHSILFPFRDNGTHFEVVWEPTEEDRATAEERRMQKHKGAGI